MKNLSPKKFEALLYGWYEKNGRDLPWRKTTDPYRIWVSETMLQQTQVERVKDYYVNFLKKFTRAEDLARASWEEVLEQWRGLGYYRRARNLHETAQIIVSTYGGKFPDDFNELQKLPGIGAYTAGALCSFAFGQDIPAIDTNVKKVFHHVFGAVWDEMGPSEQFEFVRSFIGEGNGARFHQAVMDFGTWLSDFGHVHYDCPFQGSCTGIDTADRRRSVTSGVKGKVVKVAVGILIYDGKVLIAKRLADDNFGGYWEFPGGKLEYGEDERTCLKREMMEELGVEVSVRPHFHKVFHSYGKKTYALTFHRCSLLLGLPEARASQEFRWVSRDELLFFDFMPTNRNVLDLLQRKKAMFRV